MEKRPAGPKKIGKKPSMHLSLLFFDVNSLYSCLPPGNLLSSMPVRMLRQTRQAHLTN